MRADGYLEVSGYPPLQMKVERDSGHAVRMAIDMGINRSFLHLLRSGMGKDRTAEELEEERHLVVHSRVWFCVSHLNRKSVRC